MEFKLDRSCSTLPPPLTATPTTTTCRQTIETNASQPKWTQQQRTTSHENECKEESNKMNGA